MSKRFRSTFMFQGKRYERTSTVSQRDADKKAVALQRDLESGKANITQNMRVGDFAETWLQTYKRPALAVKSYEDIERRVHKQIIPYIGNLKLHDVTDIHLQSLLNERTGKSFSELIKLRDILKAIFRKARESRLITYDPAEFLIMPKHTKGTRRSITEVEREHLLKVAETHHAGLMFLTMLYCGLRSGEVVALSWQDIDFDKQEMSITRAMESGTNTLKAPKTPAGVRIIPIPDVLYWKLLKARGEQYSPFAAAFTQVTTGERHTESSFRSSWRFFKNALDISMGARREKTMARDGKHRLVKVSSVVASDLVPYCLRHTYCTDMQNKGVSLKLASYLMGHSDISVTANVYTHVDEVSRLEAARLLGATCVRACVREDKTG